MNKNIFEELRKEHDVQRNLIGKLVATSGDTSNRQKIFNELKNELEEHAKYEERYFYKPLISSDMMQEKARHSIAEHKELDDLVEKLEDTEMSSPAWLSKAKELEHRLNHHLEEEEHEFFQLAGKVFSEDQKESLGENYRSKINPELDRTVSN